MPHGRLIRLGFLVLVAVTPLAADDFDFEAQTPIVMSGPGLFPVATDITGDGSVDVVVARATFISIYENDGLGDLLPEQSADVGAPVLSLRVGRLDADAFPDLVVGTLGGELRIHLADGTGGFPLDGSITVGALVPQFDLGDVDGDGNLDIVAPRILTNPSSSEVGVYLGTGTGDFAAPVWFPVDPGPGFARLADLDGNGTLDILVGHLEASSTLTGGIGVLSGDGLGGFSPETIVVVAPTTDVTVADLDLDGERDLIVTYVAGFCGADAQVHLADGVGGFTPGTVFGGLCGPFGAAVRDFDGDGLPDVMFPDGGDLVAATNYHEIRHGLGGGLFSEEQLVGIGLFTQTLPAVADFDGDGRTDFAAASMSSELIVHRNRTGIGTDPFRRGDVNADAATNIADAIVMLESLFGTTPIACDDAGDVNDDASVNIADPITLLAFLFAPNAPPPPAPFPDCGLDPTADALPCNPPTGCP